jgi:hypothetical protein
MQRQTKGPKTRRRGYATTRLDMAHLRREYVLRLITTPGYYAEGRFWSSELDFLRAATGNSSLEIEE